MKRKIMMLVTSTALWLGTFCPVMAQQSYHFPSVKEAEAVFAQGYELLSAMKNENFPLATIPEDSDFKDVDTVIDIPYMQSFPISISEKYNNVFYNPYQDIILSIVLKEYYKEDLEHYQDLYDEIVWKKDGSPDLTRAKTMRADLAFFNLLRNQKPTRLKLGRIDEHFPLMGVNADAFIRLQNKFGNNDAYLWFTYSIHQLRGRLWMIPREDAEQAEHIAQQIFYTDFQKYGISMEQSYEWIKFAVTSEDTALIPPKANGIRVIKMYEDDWYCEVLLRYPDNLFFINGDKNFPSQAYEPYGLIAMHEFQHVKDTFPGRTKERGDSLSELTTAIMEIVISDNIYRQIHSIPDNNSISYKSADLLGVINLGEIAVFFRELSEENKTDNWA